MEQMRRGNCGQLVGKSACDKLIATEKCPNKGCKNGVATGALLRASLQGKTGEQARAGK